MPEHPEKRESLSKNQLDLTAEYLKSEFERRKEKRKDRERIWKEVDRQIAMKAVEPETKSGQKKDWYPAIELPLQFDALEVIAADARRLKFPRGTEWYSVSAEVSDKYMERWDRQRAERPLISGSGFSRMPESPVKRLAQQMKLDQETANTLVKATLDHFHRTYDFRGAMDALDGEAIKYGTFVGRVRPVKTAKFTTDFRGEREEGREGPALIPCSIKTTYLDDTPHAVLHEGTMISPMTIRFGSQRLDDLIFAAKKGGAQRGWMLPGIMDLKPNEHQTRHVDILEAEGDFVVPMVERGSIFLPNFLITVAVSGGNARVVRMRENPVPFKSYVVGHYMKDDTESPYGSSPLTKGQPVQEAATSVMNDLLAASALSGRPPLAYDRNDPNFIASGGPEIFPGSQMPADAPNAVEVFNEWHVGDLTTAYLALLKQYEDLTSVNDARRGATVTSHTGTGAHELQAMRGISRTDDYVSGVEQGPLKTILYMEYEIIRKVMTQVRTLSVGAGGIEGWIEVSKDDLAENVAFEIHGSSGALNEQQQAQNFLNAAQFHIQTWMNAAQAGVQVPIDLSAIIQEVYQRAGIQNSGKFTAAPSGEVDATQTGPAVPGISDAIAQALAAPVQPPSNGAG